MIGFQDYFNAGVRLIVNDGLFTGSIVDADEIRLGIENLLAVVIMASLRILLQESNIVSFMVSFDVLLVS